MNRFLLVLLLLTQISKAQVISISPNSGDYGQTLNTTITLANGVINMGSPPMQMGDVYLQQGNRILYADNFTISPGPFYDDTVNATFTIPIVVPPGFYDVHVTTYQSMGWPPNPMPVDHKLTNGFTIHPAAHLLSGTVYLDVNSNGIQDGNEYGLPNVLVNISPLNISTLTDAIGMYSVHSDTGTFTITITPPANGTLTSLPTSYTITIPPDSLGNDFGVNIPLPSPLSHSFSVHSALMRCVSAGYSSYRIRNDLPVGQMGTVTLIHSPNLIFDTSSITPTSQIGNTVTWNYTLTAFGGLSDDISNSITFMNPAAGDTVWYIYIDSLFDINGVFQQMYSDTFKTVVRCSFDPNDKHASPAGEGPLNLTLHNSQFDYTINFQNTGNDTAFNITILDTIGLELDLSTIQLMDYSDQVDMVIDNTSRQIRFEFNNIMLPDSNIDEPGSHGYVIYRILPTISLADSTQIKNTAYIYFDYNSPIVTNTTNNTMVASLITAVKQLPAEEPSLLYPNPVTERSVLKIPNGKFTLSIIDISGREVLTKEVSEEYIIDHSYFAEGVYYYRLTNSNNSLSGKFIVVSSY